MSEENHLAPEIALTEEVASATMSFEEVYNMPFSEKVWLVACNKDKDFINFHNNGTSLIVNTDEMDKYLKSPESIFKAKNSNEFVSYLHMYQFNTVYTEKEKGLEFVDKYFRQDDIEILIEKTFKIREQNGKVYDRKPELKLKKRIPGTKKRKIIDVQYENEEVVVDPTEINAKIEIDKENLEEVKKRKPEIKKVKKNRKIVEVQYENEEVGDNPPEINEKMKIDKENLEEVKKRKTEIKLKKGIPVKKNRKIVEVQYENEEVVDNPPKINEEMEIDIFLIKDVKKRKTEIKLLKGIPVKKKSKIVEVQYENKENIDDPTEINEKMEIDKENLEEAYDHKSEIKQVKKKRKTVEVLYENEENIDDSPKINEEMVIEEKNLEDRKPEMKLKKIIPFGNVEVVDDPSEINEKMENEKENLEEVKKRKQSNIRSYISDHCYVRNCDLENDDAQTNIESTSAVEDTPINYIGFYGNIEKEFLDFFFEGRPDATHQKVVQSDECEEILREKKEKQKETGRTYKKKSPEIVVLEDEEYVDDPAEITEELEKYIKYGLARKFGSQKQKDVINT